MTIQEDCPTCSSAAPSPCPPSPRSQAPPGPPVAQCSWRRPRDWVGLALHLVLIDHPLQGRPRPQPVLERLPEAVGCIIQRSEEVKTDIQAQNYNSGSGDCVMPIHGEQEKPQTPQAGASIAAA